MGAGLKGAAGGGADRALLLLPPVFFITVFLGFLLRHHQREGFAAGLLLAVAGAFGGGVGGSPALGTGLGVAMAMFALAMLRWEREGEETLRRLGISRLRLLSGPLLLPLLGAALFGGVVAAAGLLRHAGLH